ncbi:MAG: enoyl-CoA hydratase/isomerase family protein [Hyphomicrobiaceae bacterium]|nr:enoyl-CoA hydratase/isomerase family protein [Hyphomicrobiaceae bacterium]
MGQFTDIAVSTEGHVAIVEIRRPPHNFFDMSLIKQIADAFEGFDKDRNIRTGVLCAQGKSFCAGANFGDGSKLDAQGNRPNENQMGGHLYQEAVRLFRTKKPIVGAIQGPAIGGGLGLALVPDFRVACPESRFAANFTKLGFHPGFGLTYTLPRLVGDQQANLMFYTGRRLNGEEAVKIGLADVLVASVDEVRSAAVKLAREISESAPLAVQETRATVRAGMADAVKAATDHELKIQSELRKTEDFKEGVRAVNERRVASFQGR